MVIDAAIAQADAAVADVESAEDAALAEDATIANADAASADAADPDAAIADDAGTMNADAAAPDAEHLDAEPEPALDAMIALDASTPADASARPDAAQLDASPDNFGATGFVLGPTAGYAGGSEDRLFAAALDSQQRIVAAGFSRDNNGRVRTVLVRYLSDGTVDPTFGGGDGVVLGPNDGARLSFSGTSDADDRFSALIVDAQDRILAAGKTSLGIGSGKLTVLARYTSSGQLDTTFGDLDGAGPARLGYVLGQGDAAGQRAFSGFAPASARPEERFNGLELDSQGRVVAAGLAAEINADYYYRTLIARFTADGALDASFAAGGFEIGRAGANWHGFYDEYISVRVLAGDAVAVAGWAGFDSSFVDERTLLVRYTNLGVLDPTFNAGATPGYRLSGPTSHAGGGKEVLYALAADSTDRLVAAGFSFEPGDSYIHVLTERFMPTGEIDLGFGTAGAVTGARGEVTGANIEYLVAAAVDSRGFIIVAGFTDEANSTIVDNVDQAILLRYTTDGLLDTEISTWTNNSSELAGGTDDAFYAVVIAPGDELYAIGTSGGRALIVRYTVDGCLDAPGPCAN